MKLLIALLLFFSALSIHAQNWTSIGPQGGYFKEFSFHPTNPSTLYAGSDDGGGIWRSTNDGQDWTLLTENFPNMTGWSITIDNQTPDVIYACDVYGRYGLLKSTDGGSTWNQSTNGLSTNYELMVSGLTMKSSDTLFISTGEGANTTPPRPGNGVFKSFDAGNSWTPAGLQGETVLSIGNNIFGTVFAGTEANGLQFTNDNGATWAPHPDITNTAVVFEIEVEGNVIAVASSAGVFLSTNWGVNFINTGLAGEFNFDVCIHQTTPDVELICPTFVGLQQYSSATSNWSILADPLLDDKLVIGIGSNGDDIYAGTFSNSPIIALYDGAANWTEAASSPFCTEISTLAIDQNNSSNIVTGLLGTYNIGGNYNAEALYTTNDGGLNWTRKGPEAHAISVTPNPDRFASSYLGTFSQGLFKTYDGFDTYINLISGNKLIADIAIEATDTNVVIVSQIDLDITQSSIQRSIDGGINFSNVSAIAANRLTFHSSEEDSVFAATTDGIYLSADNGVTWNVWQLSGVNVQSILHDGTLYAGTDAGELYHFENGMLTNISGPWATPVQIKSIHKENGHLIVGLNGAEQDTTNELSGSLWMSSDNGSNWTEITGNIYNTNVYGNNVVASNNGELIVGTYGGGIFQSSGLTLNTQVNSQPSFDFQVFPNPSSDYIAISVDTKETLPLEISDVSGKVVHDQTVVDGQIISLGHLPKGIYYITLKSDAMASTISFVRQ